LDAFRKGRREIAERLFPVRREFPEHEYGMNDALVCCSYRACDYELRTAPGARTLAQEDLMNRLILTAAALTLVSSLMPANAQTPLRANERFCLEVRDATGPHPLLCRFENMEQCNASKTGFSDHCMINPEIAFQQQRTNRR
jgi:hypothetical protein